MVKANIKIKPMLAYNKEVNVYALRYPLMASPKLDGVRALVMDGTLVSRKLIPIPNRHTQKLFSSLREGTDGELIVGEPNKDPYRRTVGAVRREHGEPAVRFYIFDNFTAKGGFYDRHVSLPDSTEFVRVVPHTIVRNAEELLALEQEFLSQGYEGLMIRSMDGPYKYGRSTLKEGYLLKLKRFKDSEAVVLSCYERMHNTNEATLDNLGNTKRSTAKEGMEPTGMLGGFIVRDVNPDSEFFGVEFDVSASTILLDELKPMWDHRGEYIGQVLVYKYFPSGSKERPRLPTFKGFRADIDNDNAK